MIYIKEHNSLFDSPRVEEPKKKDFHYVGEGYYYACLEAYNKWLSSKVEVVGDHTWVDLQEVKEGIDYRLTGGHRKRNGDGTTSITPIVAIPKEKDNDVTSQHPLKNKMDEFFKNITSEELIKRFESMGYKFVTNVPPNDSTPVEQILCAAIWYKEIQLKKEIQNSLLRPVNIERGVVFCGYRHHHCMYTMIAVTGLRSVTNGRDSVGAYSQGFLTNKNRFVDRQEAAQIYFKATGKTLQYSSTELYSEDLY